MDGKLLVRDFMMQVNTTESVTIEEVQILDFGWIKQGIE